MTSFFSKPSEQHDITESGQTAVLKRRSRIGSLVLVLTIIGALGVMVVSMYIEKHGGERLATEKVEIPVRQGYCYGAENFNSLAERGLVLVDYWQKTKKAVSPEKETLDKLFFCAFPSSFRDMQKLFLTETDESITAYFDNANWDSPIKYFSELTSIPREEYYKKYIDISVGGFYQGDYIAQAFGLAKRIENDSANALEVLQYVDSADMYSVFHFMFDGYEPENYKDDVARLYKIMSAQQPDLAIQMESAYGVVLRESEGI